MWSVIRFSTFPYVLSFSKLNLIQTCDFFLYNFFMKWADFKQPIIYKLQGERRPNCSRLQLSRSCCRLRPSPVRLPGLEAARWSLRQRPDQHRRHLQERRKRQLRLGKIEFKIEKKQFPKILLFFLLISWINPQQEKKESHCKASTCVGSANRIFSFYASTLKSQQIFCKYLPELVYSFTTNLNLNP